MGHEATPWTRLGPVIHARPVLGNAKNWWDDRFWEESGKSAIETDGLVSRRWLNSFNLPSLRDATGNLTIE